MLERLECFNFKSYKGHVTIGPFHSFTAVIGPNGAGKSNLMDAISFVLGVRSATLRSAALKDLIYRKGKKKGGNGKGKAKAVDEDSGEEDEGSEEDAEEEEEGGQDGERTAWVLAVYVDGDGKEWKFQRSISTAGTSEYKLNSKTVTYKKYNDQLESFNILVKAKNFLVFQGDVEAVASQSPKDLAKLIDQISGSLDLKEEYDKAAKELEKATEESVMQHGRRKGVNGEIKQYKEMQKEAERWRVLGEQKDDAVIRHLLWKLFHIEDGIKTNTAEVEEKNLALVQYRKEHSKFDESQKAAKKEVTRAQKDASKQEKSVKAAEKRLEESRPELVAIDAKIAHANKKLKKADDAAKAIQGDLTKGDEKLASLQTDFDKITKAAQRHKEEVEKLAKSKGFILSDEDLKDYRDLKAQANLKAVAEREALHSLQHEEKTQRDALTSTQDSLETQERKLEKIQAEDASLTNRKIELESKVKDIQKNLTKTTKEYDDLEERVRQTRQTEKELNEKLSTCVSSLAQAGADKRESERDAKFRQTLADLKRAFPGVKGRVIDLCKPTHQKYSLAVTTILGRNIDSVVVDSEKTAIACIEYLRVQRAGQATFIPLETIQARAVNDKYRSFARGARLAIDVITFDASVEKAMQHACGNGLVCDTMDIARHVCYEKGQEVKAVTLEGTVIHRSGNITGGNSIAAGANRTFEDGEVEGLRRRKDELVTKLAEIQKNKPRANVGDQLVAEKARLEADLTIARDDLAATTTRLKGVTSELKVVKKSVDDLKAKLKKITADLEASEEKIAGYRETIDAAESSIFRDFCRRIKVGTIREYEETQLKAAQEGNEATLKYDTQLAKLRHQLKFNGEQVDATRERLTTVEATAADARDTLAKLEDDKTEATTAQEAIETEIEELKATLEELQAELAEKTSALEEVRKQGSKSGKVVDKALKEIASCNDEIEKLSSERFTIYRRCKLEEISLPLDDGSLDNVPIEENANEKEDEMDVDADDDGTQKVAQVKDYGVTVDFEALEEEETENASEEMETELLDKIAKIQAEMEKMSPNRKAIERLGDSEARFKEIDGEFDQAREAAKSAKDNFMAIKKKRCDLFNKAYNHISDRIDEVYKDLTKGTMAPMGGVAYLSLEDSEEPYLHGIKYHAMPPMKRFRDMDQLSGGEKTMAALALLFAIHSFHPSPFFVLDEVDAALDNTNVSKLAVYIKKLANPDFQFLLISLKPAFFQKASALVGVYREDGGSRNLTLDLTQY